MAQRRGFSCTCGYRGQITVGGMMSNFATHNPFPILCRSCKALASVNQARDAEKICMACGGNDFLVYGEETRLPSEIEELRSKQEREVDEQLKAIRSLSPEECLEIYGVKGPIELTPEEIAEWRETLPTSWDEGHHLCPLCGQYGLTFGRITMFLD